MGPIVLDCILLSLLFCGTAAAHDCWLQPGSFYYGVGAAIFAKIFVGHLLKKDKELPLEKKITQRLEYHTNNGSFDLLSRLDDNRIPAIELEPNFIGPSLFVMNRDFNHIELNNEQFAAYLVHENHPELLPTMKANPRGVQKERYARCMKFLVLVGDSGKQSIHDKAVGQKLEIVLKSNPFQITFGMLLEVDVLFDSHPLPHKFITAVKRSPNGQVTDETVKTNDCGTAGFNVEEPGIWLMRLVHLTPYQGENDLDWESYWSSYCFEIRENPS